MTYWHKRSCTFPTALHSQGRMAQQFLTSPGGFTQFGGGGFVPQASPLPDGEKQAQFEKTGSQTLRSLSFAQIQKAIMERRDSGSEGLKVDGEVVSDVKSVCQILDVQDKGNHVEYRVDDTTGHMVVKDFKGRERVAAADLHIYKYVEVFGSLHELDATFHLLAYHIRPVVDYNKVSCHHLEIIHQHLIHTKGPLEEDRPPQQQAVSFQTPPLGGSMYGGMLGAAKESRLDAEIHRMFIESGGVKNPQGLHKNEIYGRLQSWPRHEVDQQLQLAINCGRMYEAGVDRLQWNG